VNIAHLIDDNTNIAWFHLAGMSLEERQMMFVENFFRTKALHVEQPMEEHEHSETIVESDSEVESSIFSTFLRRLQETLSRTETFEVVTCQQTSLSGKFLKGNYIVTMIIEVICLDTSNLASMLGKQARLRLVAGKCRMSRL
jgi:hypothetical protein